MYLFFSRLAYTIPFKTCLIHRRVMLTQPYLHDIYLFLDKSMNFKIYYDNPSMVLNHLEVIKGNLYMESFKYEEIQWQSMQYTST